MTVYNRTVATAEFLPSLPRTINVSCQMALSQTLQNCNSLENHPLPELIGEIKKPGYLRNVVAFGADMSYGDGTPSGVLRFDASEIRI